MKKVFLAISDFSSENIQMLLDQAVKLKKERTKGENQPLLKGKTMAMIFQKPSLYQGSPLIWNCSI